MRKNRISEPAKANFKEKSYIIGEAVVVGTFIVASGLAAITLLNLNTVVLEDQAKAWIGYILAGYAAVAFGFTVYKAAANKGE